MKLSKSYQKLYQKIIFVMFISLAMFISVKSYSIGILLPTQQEFPALNLKEHNVFVDIKGSVAKTKVEHIFYNSYNRQLEATFIFPVPKNADITNFALWINGKKMEGEVLEKEKAREIYEDIVRRAKDPGLLEFVNHRIFKVRIFPIPAMGDQKVEIEYTQVLTADKGLLEYSYSMRGSAYSGDERIIASEINFAKCSFNIDIKSDKPILTLYSPTHKISEKKDKNNNIKVLVDEKSIEPDKDFKLFFQSSEKDYGISLIPYEPESDEDGYFMMIISPKQNIKDEDVEPKAVTFVLDISGSMLDNDKLVQAKKALNFCLSNLNDKDVFNILTFSTNIEKFSDKHEVANDDYKSKAKKFVDKLKALGGTNIHEALQAALKSEIPQDMLHVIIFITDGLPTVGNTNPESIVDDAQKLNTKNTRIFSFGVGYNVNTYLLDMIADKTNAFSEYIAPDEDMEVKISNFYTKVQSPVLTNLNVKIDNVKVSELYPKTLPDMFVGSDVLVFGRYENGGEANITLSGQSKGKEQKFTYSSKFPNKDEENEFVEKLWGTRKIGYLLDEIRKNGENEELKNEVIRLAKKYSVVTPYTSYLVVEDEAGYAGDRFRRRPQELSFGQQQNIPNAMAPVSKGMIKYSESRDMAVKSMSPASAPAESTGQQAVEYSKMISDIKTKKEVDNLRKEQIKTVLGKTFKLNQNGEWIDGEIEKQKIDEAKTVKIKAFSKGYFDMLTYNSDLTKIVAIGKNIRFVYEGWLIVIADDGGETLPDELIKVLKGKK